MDTLKTEYPTHSTIGGYTIAYVTTDGECYCGDCIADVIESDIYLLPSQEARNYDYPIGTILHQEHNSEKYLHELPTTCEICECDIDN
jgi:hypothetical protein